MAREWPRLDSRSWPDNHWVDLLAERAARHPERVALRFLGEDVAEREAWTYAELHERARALAAELQQRAPAGSRALLLYPNGPHYVTALLGCLYAGIVCVPAYPPRSAQPQHVERILSIARDAQPSLILTERAWLDALRALAGGLPGLESVQALATDAPRGVGAESYTPPALSPDSLALLHYTSGSTSTPKGVQLQHYALIENMWHIGERMHVTQHDRLWLAVSLFWGLGCENALFNLMTHGGCVVLQESFEPGEALRIISGERCTIFYGMPNMVQAMAEHPDRPNYDLSSLRAGGTLGTPEQLQRVVDLGVKDFSTIYGLTESYGNCTVADGLDPLEIRIATVGRPLPGVDLRIIDVETGREQPRGTVGEVRLKGYVTIGYYKDEDKNREAFDANGYFRTGDLGFLDENDNLYFRGRLKEMIKTGGINVAPVEVEESLLRHPDVKLAFVTGVPDAVRDEVIAAVIVRHDGREVDAPALTEHCRRELASYKVPRLITFVNETDLPLTTTGKLQKNRLADFFTRNDARPA